MTFVWRTRANLLVQALGITSRWRPGGAGRADARVAEGLGAAQQPGGRHRLLGCQRPRHLRPPRLRPQAHRRRRSHLRLRRAGALTCALAVRCLYFARRKVTGTTAWVVRSTRRMAPSIEVSIRCVSWCPPPLMGALRMHRSRRTEIFAATCSRRSRAGSVPLACRLAGLRCAEGGADNFPGWQFSRPLWPARSR